jgi:ribosome-binding protein aMBF1 (putative translation factor)
VEWLPMPPKRNQSSPEAINENFGKRVKKLRGDRGWSLEELVNVSGVSRSMLSEIGREKAVFFVVIYR